MTKIIIIEKGFIKVKKIFLGMVDELVIINEKNNGGFDIETRLEGTHPVDLVQHPDSPEIMYCATYGNGLWKSNDEGNHWKAIGQMNAYHEPTKGLGIKSAYITAVAINPNNPDILYVGTEPSAIYYSEDGSQTFTEFEEVQNLPSQPFWEFPARPYTHHVQDLMPSSKEENTLNAAIEFGAFINSNDGGESWNDRPFFSPRDVHQMATHNAVPGKLFAVCGDGLAIKGHSFAESDNDGMSWSYSSEGLEKYPYLYTIAVNPNSERDIFVGAAENAFAAHHRDEDKGYPRSTVFRRNDEGSWEDSSEGLPNEDMYISQLEADPKALDTFYALNNRGLYKFANSEWNRVDIPWKEKYLDQHPTFLKIIK